MCLLWVFIVATHTGHGTGLDGASLGGVRREVLDRAQAPTGEELEEPKE
jgi:hypothetical protein